MLDGSHLLVDEISLAEDSVLERLNSVLESERKLNVPDKIGDQGKPNANVDGTTITASKSFQFMATMNPGGDYGKKELSPALKNRMTEIWCDANHDPKDLVLILKHNLHLDQQVCVVVSARVSLSFVDLTFCN